MVLLFSVSLIILLKLSLCGLNFNDSKKHVDKNVEGNSEPH